MPEDTTTNEPTSENEEVETTQTSEGQAQPEDTSEAPRDETSQSEPSADLMAQAEPVQAPVNTAPVAMPEPVQVKNLLVGVYNEVERLRAHLQVSVASTAYKDVDELLQHFENAKDWLAQKVTQYDPDLGKELSSTQKPE